KTDRDAPEPGQRLNILMALIVIDVDALAPFDDQRPGLFVLAEITVGMGQVGDIARGGRIRCNSHAGCLVQRIAFWPGKVRILHASYHRSWPCTNVCSKQISEILDNCVRCSLRGLFLPLAQMNSLDCTAWHRAGFWWVLSG